ncbi:MAG: thiamine phosphate synthase [Lachnospiraceae bacterium]|nr:thiamine phosphate synthase [Lachnospiraceae bacterium]
MLICVTNRKLCQDDFLLRLDRIAAQHPYAVILREKDLSEDEYEELAAKCLAICKSHGVPMQVHNWVDVARRIGCDGIHLSFRTFMEYVKKDGESSGPCGFSDAVRGERIAACRENDALRYQESQKNSENVFSGFNRIGVSLHSAEEAGALQGTPATYIQAGHIFATDCKRGVPPRGLNFLREVCRATDLPVFAIGGITPERYPAALEAGAAGVCVMSGLMECRNVEEYMGRF